jgi:ketol-acid reductoisomerase
MKTDNKSYLTQIMRNSARMYFAPLFGAINAVRKEVHRINYIQDTEKRNNKTSARTINGKVYADRFTLLHTQGANDIENTKATTNGHKIWPVESKSSSTFTEQTFPNQVSFPR